MSINFVVKKNHYYFQLLSNETRVRLPVMKVQSNKILTKKFKSVMSTINKNSNLL